MTPTQLSFLREVKEASLKARQARHNAASVGLLAIEDPASKETALLCRECVLRAQRAGIPQRMILAEVTL